jgi:hypothetical protein
MHACRQACLKLQCPASKERVPQRTRRTSASRRSTEIQAAASSFRRMSTFVFTLFTFWPPAPPLRANVMVTSPAEEGSTSELRQMHAAVSEHAAVMGAPLLCSVLTMSRAVLGGLALQATADLWGAVLLGLGRLLNEGGMLVCSRCGRAIFLRCCLAVRC